MARCRMMISARRRPEVVRTKGDLENSLVVQAVGDGSVPWSVEMKSQSPLHCKLASSS